MPPHLKCDVGDIVFVRGTVTRAESDAFEVRFERGNIIARAWVPSGEVAKREDIDGLSPAPRQITHLFAAECEKLPKLVSEGG
jgi:hypothetical protein